MPWDDWELAFKNLFFPQFCGQCGVRLLTEENRNFCPRCWEISPRIARPFCTVCGKPHAGAAGFGTLSNFPCAPCNENRSGYVYLDRVYGAAMYDGALSEAVKLMKFHDKPWLARPLAEAAQRFAEEEMDLSAYDYLIPVPLYHVRERERGFNQSLLLAAALAPAFSHARVDQALERIRPTLAQSTLKDEKERRENVRNAFAVRRRRHLKGARILLVDDVITTGGTVEECTKVLRSAGAARVDALAICLAARRLAEEEQAWRDVPGVNPTRSMSCPR